MTASRTILRWMRLCLLEDWLLKLACLLLATLAWIYIDGQLTDQRELTKTLTFDREALALPEGMELVYPEKKYNVLLKVRGLLRRLPVLSVNDVKFDNTHLLPDPQRGLNRIRLETVRFKLERQEGMSVISVEPKEMDIEIRMIEQKRVPVRARTTDNLPNGYRVMAEATRVLPQEVSITSAENLDQVTFVWTEPIDVSIRYRDRDFRTEVGIAPVVSVGEGDLKRAVSIRCDAKVTVWLQIRLNEISNSLENVPVQVLTPPGTAISVDHPNLTVLVKGPESEVTKIIKDPALLRLYVEWPSDWEAQAPPGETPTAQPQQVKYIAPPGVTVSDPGGEPLRVKIRRVRTGALPNP